MQTNGGVEVKVHAFSTSTVAGCERSDSLSDLFTADKTASDPQSLGDWESPRAIVNAMAKRIIALAGITILGVQPAASLLLRYLVLLTEIPRLADWNISFY
jgi:hypothetical protein